MPNWERYLLLTLLGPLFWVQAKYVRQVTPRMPEPPGSRSAVCGTGPLVRVLVVGDSAAAGVGAASQDEALCGQLIARLGQHHSIAWRLLAMNGLDSPGLVQMLENAPNEHFDVVVVSVGANDVTSLLSPCEWIAWQDRLAHVVDRRFGPELLVHSAVPPMHAFTAIPQPLRWFAGRWAQEMNRLLSAVLIGKESGRTMHWHPHMDPLQGLAIDGYHPGPKGYALWAEGLSEHILKYSGCCKPQVTSAAVNAVAWP